MAVELSGDRVEDLESVQTALQDRVCYVHLTGRRRTAVPDGGLLRMCAGLEPLCRRRRTRAGFVPPPIASATPAEPPSLACTSRRPLSERFGCRVACAASWARRRAASVLLRSARPVPKAILLLGEGQGTDAVRLRSDHRALVQLERGGRASSESGVDRALDPARQCVLATDAPRRSLLAPIAGASESRCHPVSHLIGRVLEIGVLDWHDRWLGLRWLGMAHPCAQEGSQGVVPDRGRQTFEVCERAWEAALP